MNLYGWNIGGSTFSGATPPSYLSRLSSLASPEEWKTQGTAFIQNPQLLESRAKQEQLGRQRQFETASMGDPTQAGKRAYEMGLRTEELERLRMASEQQKLQSQMAFQPQMEAIRGGIMSRMAGNLGVTLPPPSMGGYSSSYSPSSSWMQNYQVPQFPR